MSGETNLKKLLHSMSAILSEDLFVFATIPDRQIPAGIDPVMSFREVEGTTLILKEETAIANKVRYEFRCRMITLDVHSSLEAVGFIAKVATALAEEDMGVNPVSGFFHDHLFVPLGREQDALRVIEELSDGMRLQSE